MRSVTGLVARASRREAFRSHHNQGFDDFAKCLPTDEVKIVGGCCGICDGHIVLCAKLKESLQPSAGVFGTLAVVAVRKKQSEAGTGAPLGFGGGDVLIDLCLSPVCKITELRFPDNQHLGAVERVAVIEAQHGGLG